MKIFGRNKKKKDRKKFKDTRVYKFLKEKGSKIVEVAADVLPDKGGLGIVKRLIETDNDLSPQDKEMALKHLEFDMIQSQEVTKRWEADMLSDSWLSKNSRPLVLLFFVGALFIFMMLDSMNINFDVKDRWISLYEIALITVVGAYFGAREIGKYHAWKYSGKEK